MRPFSVHLIFLFTFTLPNNFIYLLTHKLHLMPTKPTNPPITLNDLHFILASLPDIFCHTVCKACNWTEANYHFHLKHPGHISKAEKRKINEILNNLLMITYVETPKLSIRRGNHPGFSREGSPSPDYCGN